MSRFNYPRQVARFERKVVRNGPVPEHCPDLGPCHLWRGSHTEKGYGRVYFLGKDDKAHRAAFFIAHGRYPMPCGLHKCDNPGCVNAAHLFEGTKAENNADMKAKGRHALGDKNGSRAKPHRMPRGENHVNSKLTEQCVRDIRATFARGGVSQEQLGHLFGVSRRLVGGIVRGERWTHVAL